MPDEKQEQFLAALDNFQQTRALAHIYMPRGILSSLDQDTWLSRLCKELSLIQKNGGCEKDFIDRKCG
jgi:hypothetical protein